MGTLRLQRLQHLLCNTGGLEGLGLTGIPRNIRRGGVLISSIAGQNGVH